MNEEQPLSVRLFSMTLEPLGGNMVVRPIVEEVSKGGILLPEFASDAESRLNGPIQVGEVLRCGSEVDQFSPGDIIGYSHYSASKAREGEEILHIVTAETIQVKYASPVTQ